MKEKDICIEMGISRDLLKMMRSSYSEGQHWNKVASKKPEHLWSIEWTEAGIEAIRMNLGIGPKDDSAEQPKEMEGILKAKYKNPRIMCITINGKDHNVLCRDSSKFVVGMKIYVKWDGSRWFVSRHPRYNGKY